MQVRQPPALILERIEVLRLGLVHQEFGAAQLPNALRQADVVRVHVRQQHHAQVAPSNADLAQSGFERGETLRRIHAAVDQQVAMVECDDVEVDLFELERQGKLDAVNARDRWLRSAHWAGTLAWYELRTRGPDSTCLNPHS